jgi:uncharacterized repeat protein (TIGR01451 family)
MPRRITFAAVLILPLLFTGCSDNPPAATGGDTLQPSARVSRSPLQPSTTPGPSDLVRNALAVPTGDLSTSTVLVEKFGPGEARLNRPYDYRIRVTNLTDTPLAGVVVRERIPENFSVSKSEPAAREESGWLMHTVGDLPARGAKTIDVTGVAKAEGTVDTCIAVDYKPTLCAVTQVVNPIIQLSKEAPADVDLCEGIRYRYVISNVGTGTEKELTIEDALPDGLATEDGKQTVSLRVGDLPQSMSKEFTIRVKPARTGTYASAAVAKAPGGVEVRSKQASTTVHQPKLEVAIEGPAKEYLNKVATYTVHVKNTGDAPARRTSLGIDTAEHGEITGVAVKGGSAEIAAAPYKKEGVDLDTIAPGQSRTATVSVRTTHDGALTVVAAAVATCVAPVSAKTATDILTLPALRLEVVDLDDPIRVGDNVTYRVTVKNQGTGADTHVAITATLPPELEYVSASGPSEPKVDGQTLTFTPLQALAAGQEAAWRIQAKATKVGDVRLKVQLKSDSLTTAATETEPTRLY